MPANPSCRRTEFLYGARDTIPMIVGAIPFGILFGVLAVSAGLSLFGTMGMSLFVFAGSSQFVAATLLAQGVGVLVIILTTLILNVRHALYSASLAPYVGHLRQRWLLVIGFFLTDETFAVVIKRFSRGGHDKNNRWYYLGSALAMYLNWQICTLVGFFAGSNLQGMSEWGLEFAMVVTFIGIIVPLVIDGAMLITAVLAVAVGLVTKDFPHNLGLLVAALVAIAGGYLYETYRLNSKVAESVE